MVELGLNLEAECLSTFNMTCFKRALAAFDHTLNKKSISLILNSVLWLPVAVSTSFNMWKMLSSPWFISELLYCEM